MGAAASAGSSSSLWTTFAGFGATGSATWGPLRVDHFSSLGMATAGAAPVTLAAGAEPGTQPVGMMSPVRTF